MSTPFKVVIPSRYASTRLPGKPLLNIAGKPMIAHVCERASQAGAEDIVVATDDKRIFDTVTGLGINVLMTDPNHQSGTERIAEVAQHYGWHEQSIIVNLQGDEPLIPPDYIRDVAFALAGQTQAGIATLAAKILDEEEISNPNAVKVVVDKNSYALYFSRATIPHCRDLTNRAATTYLRHIGMYAYTVGFLNRYCAWQASPLESIESLEQLRILWHGDKVLIKVVDKTPAAGVDTPEDLLRVEQIILASNR
jgi:3-deoxy-manno-octulosonate cytidylyltransferase (CMP-KDO synthetase)